MKGISTLCCQIGDDGRYAFNLTLDGAHHHVFQSDLTASQIADLANAYYDDLVAALLKSDGGDAVREQMRVGGTGLFDALVEPTRQDPFKSLMQATRVCALVGTQIQYLPWEALSFFVEERRVLLGRDVFFARLRHCHDFSSPREVNLSTTKRVHNTAATGSALEGLDFEEVPSHDALHQMVMDADCVLFACKASADSEVLYAVASEAKYGNAALKSYPLKRGSLVVLFACGEAPRKASSGTLLRSRVATAIADYRACTVYSFPTLLPVRLLRSLAGDYIESVCTYGEDSDLLDAHSRWIGADDVRALFRVEGPWDVVLNCLEKGVCGHDSGD